MRHLCEKRDILLSELKFPWLQSFLKEVAKVPLKSECTRTEKPNLWYFTRLFFPPPYFYVCELDYYHSRKTYIAVYVLLSKRMFTNIGFSHCWNQTVCKARSHSTIENSLTSPPPIWMSLLETPLLWMNEDKHGALKAQRMSV